MFDYHVHTEFSVDCATPMWKSCQAAVERGITEIAFTDHLDFQPDDPGFGYYDRAAYLRSLESVRSEFDSRLIILAGAEVDFHTETQRVVESFIAEAAESYDFIIGSVHYGANGNPIYPDYYATHTLDEVIFAYLDQLEAAVKTQWFNTIGHMDLPKRYLPAALRSYDPLRYRDRLETLFEAMIKHGVAFEINTSGIRQAPGTSMPGPAIVRWYAEAGGRLITTGTDSHSERTIGAGIPETLEMLSLCGIPEVQRFRMRQPESVSIDSLLAEKSR